MKIGFKFTKESRQKMRDAQIGKKHSKETIEKIKNFNIGKKLSEEHKRKISEHHKKNGVGKWMLGRNKGKNCKWWKGGVTGLGTTIRSSFKYRQWISDIFTRDDFICQGCFSRGGKLHAHHIKAFSLILKENKIKSLKDALSCEELWNINNGRTLCFQCHKKTDNYLKKFIN